MHCYVVIDICWDFQKVPQKMSFLPRKGAG